jgi:hypothetical protein
VTACIAFWGDLGFKAAVSSAWLSTGSETTRAPATQRKRKGALPVDIPIAVIVRVSLGDPLGDAMSHVRKWLDSEKIRPTSFPTTVDARGYRLAVGFRSGWDADRFRRRYSA